jgi:hypothetical protein
MVPISTNFSPYRAGIGSHRPFPAGWLGISPCSRFSCWYQHVYGILELLILPRTETAPVGHLDFTSKIGLESRWYERTISEVTTTDINRLWQGLMMVIFRISTRTSITEILQTKHVHGHTKILYTRGFRTQPF